MPIHPILGAVLPYMQGENVFQMIGRNIQEQQIRKERAAELQSQIALRERQAQLAERQEQIAQQKMAAAPIEQKLAELLTGAKIGKEEALAKKAIAEAGISPLRGKLLEQQILSAQRKGAIPVKTTQQEILEKARGAVVTEQLKNIYGAEQTATRGLQSLELFKSAMKDIPEFWTGKLAGPLAPYVSGEHKAAAQLADSAHAMMTASLLEKVKTGALTEKERVFFERAAPDIRQDKDAALKLADFIEAKFKRDIQQRKFMDQMLEEGTSFQEANDLWMDYIKNNELIDDEGNVKKVQDFTGWEKGVKAKQPTKVTGGYKGTPGTLKQWKEASTETGIPVEKLVADYRRNKGIK